MYGSCDRPGVGRMHNITNNTYLHHIPVADNTFAHFDLKWRKISEFAFPLAKFEINLRLIAPRKVYSYVVRSVYTYITSLTIYLRSDRDKTF